MTPISRPLVKGANIFLAARAANSVIGFFKQWYSNRARFFGCGCERKTCRARHPSGSSAGRTMAGALAALPPQKNVGTAPYPK